MPTRSNSKGMPWSVPAQKVAEPTLAPQFDFDFDVVDDLNLGPDDSHHSHQYNAHLNHNHNHDPNPSPGNHTRDSSSDIDSDVFPSPHYFPSPLSAELSPPLIRSSGSNTCTDDLHLNFGSSMGFYSPPERPYLDSFDYDQYASSSPIAGPGDKAFLPSWNMHDASAVRSPFSSGSSGLTSPIPVPSAGTTSLNMPFGSGMGMLPPLPFPSFDAYPQTASFSPSDFMAPAPLPPAEQGQDYMMDDVEERKPQWAADLWGAPGSPTSPTSPISPTHESGSDSTLTLRPTRHSFLAPSSPTDIPYPFTASSPFATDFLVDQSQSQQNTNSGYGGIAISDTGRRKRAVSHRGGPALAQLFQSSSLPGPGLASTPSMARRMSSASGSFLVSGSPSGPLLGTAEGSLLGTASPSRMYSTRKAEDGKNEDDSAERTIRERRTSRRSPPVRGLSPGEEGADKSAKSHLRPPKLAPSAWQLYFTDWIQKHQATSTRKLNVAQAAKEAGQEYATLTAEEKEPYKRKSQSMKEQRERELSTYMHSLTPDDIKRENVFRAEQRKLGRSRKSNIKDPNAPKKPLSAYFMFLQWIRASQGRVNEVFGTETETTKQSVLAAAQWRAMTDDERKPFLAQAEQEKMEYEAARRVYEEGSAGGVSMSSGTNIHFSIMSQSPHSPGFGNGSLPLPGTGAFSSTTGFTTGGVFAKEAKVEPESDNELSSSADEMMRSTVRRR